MIGFVGKFHVPLFDNHTLSQKMDIFLTYCSHLKGKKKDM